jgi:hypothetical protein
MSDLESDGYEFSQLYRSSYQSISSITEDEDEIENYNLAIIHIDHNYSQNSIEEENNETSVTQHKKRKLLYKLVNRNNRHTSL